MNAGPGRRTEMSAHRPKTQPRYTTVRLELRPETLARLERLSRVTGRSLDDLVVEAMVARLPVPNAKPRRQ